MEVGPIRQFPSGIHITAFTLIVTSTSSDPLDYFIFCEYENRFLALGRLRIPCCLLLYLREAIDIIDLRVTEAAFRP
jgi:hypothetical protein